jgi:hypothetical protein
VSSPDSSSSLSNPTLSRHAITAACRAKRTKTAGRQTGPTIYVRLSSRRFSLKGWQKIAGGKRSAATGNVAKCDSTPNGGGRKQESGRDLAFSGTPSGVRDALCVAVPVVARAYHRLFSATPFGVTPRSSPAFSTSWMRAPSGRNFFSSLAPSFAECVSPESTSLSSSLCLRYATVNEQTGWEQHTQDP